MFVAKLKIEGSKSVQRNQHLQKIKGSLKLLWFLALTNLGINMLCPKRQQNVHCKPKHASNCHHNKHKHVAVGPNASGPTSTRANCGLRIVDNASKQAREEEGAQGKVEDENVVQEAIVFETK